MDQNIYEVRYRQALVQLAQHIGKVRELEAERDAALAFSRKFEEWLKTMPEELR